MRSLFLYCSGAMVFAVGTMASTGLGAKEVDTFSINQTSMTDVTTLLDREFNNHLVTAIEASNRGQATCSKRSLYRSIRSEFSNHLSDRFTKKLFRSATFPKTTIKVADSIYSDVGLAAPVLWVQGKLGSRLIAIQYGGIPIGLDKLEHFFGSGYLYFEMHYLRHAPLSEALYFGAKREVGVLGGNTTGVISFADLSANFNGMRFWNHLLNENPDVIGQQPIEPYVACSNNSWVLTHPVALTNYVDQTWNETFNCNRFSSIVLARNVARNIRQLADNADAPLSCERDEPQLASFESKYRSVAPWILNLGETEIDRHFPKNSSYRLLVRSEIQVEKAP